jgi:dTMP kinase
MDQALFFTFEGGEGGGKSTQAKLLYDWMVSRNIPCEITKEPGTNHVEECIQIRELVLNPKYNLVPSAELLLFLADRAQHIERFIKPTLEKGIHVICDRFSDSTRVYQSSRGLNKRIVDQLVDFATGGLKPDVTFLLDVPVAVGLDRAKAKSVYKEGDRMEMAGSKFHEAVRHGFLKLAESLDDGIRWKVINAAPPKDISEVHKEVVEYVSQKLWFKE